MSRVVALIPAHNEAENITATVGSLLNQSRLPDRVVVVADNCTDDTAALARSAGAEVLETVGNTAKKAGALNQGLRHVIGQLCDDDMVLTVDADSVLIPKWIELAVPHLTAREGGISGAYVPKRLPGLVPTLQAMEYAQERRRISRRGGVVSVLSGAAALFRVDALRYVARERGGSLPGTFGDYYDEVSLTEDFEITIALQTLGYRPRCPKECVVVTEIMTTWGALFTQRLRWQRGTVETLLTHGWRPTTRRLWATQAWTYLRTGVWPLVVVMLAATLVVFGGLTFTPIFLAILPLVMVEQTVTSWKAGPRVRLMAALLLPGIIYDNFRSVVYWVALRRAVMRTEKTWVTN